MSSYLQRGQAGIANRGGGIADVEHVQCIATPKDVYGACEGLYMKHKGNSPYSPHGLVFVVGGVSTSSLLITDRCVGLSYPFLFRLPPEPSFWD